jgi:hypothetical protein
VTSTRLSSIDNGLSSCSLVKWTVITTYGLWLGNDQLSVAMLNLPSYPFGPGWVLEPLNKDSPSDLQWLGKTPSNTNEHILDIARKSLCGGDIVIRPPHLHKASKAMVIDYLEWPIVLCYPADEFNTVNAFSEMSEMKYRLSIPCFTLGMLVVTVYGLSSLAHFPKDSCDWCIIGLCAFECCMCGCNVLGTIGCLNSLITPTDLGMTPEITGWFGITCI